RPPTVPGGVIGNQGNQGGTPGIPGGNIGNPTVPPNPAIPPTIPPNVGQILIYNCSRCKAQVSETATRCPSCNAIFTNRIQGAWDDRPNRGNQTPPQATLVNTSTPTGPRDGNKSSEEGLSVPVILGVAIGGPLLLG